MTPAEKAFADGTASKGSDFEMTVVLSNGRSCTGKVAGCTEDILTLRAGSISLLQGGSAAIKNGADIYLDVKAICAAWVHGG